MKAVFIDKDGTLVDNVPYSVDPAALRFRAGALRALGDLARAGFVLLLASNQSGVGRGFFSPLQLAHLLAFLRRRLCEEAGVALLDCLVCPHVPGPNGAPACACRKPAPGLFLEAERRHGIDLARSWMVGDTLDDIEAGHRAGCRAVLLGHSDDALLPAQRRPDHCCASWRDIVPLILAAEHTDCPAGFSASAKDTAMPFACSAFPAFPPTPAALTAWLHIPAPEPTRPPPAPTPPAQPEPEVPEIVDPPLPDQELPASDPILQRNAGSGQARPAGG